MNFIINHRIGTPLKNAKTGEPFVFLGEGAPEGIYMKVNGSPILTCTSSCNVIVVKIGNEANRNEAFGITQKSSPMVGSVNEYDQDNTVLILEMDNVPALKAKNA